MNILSEDEVLKLLQFLPGNDVLRFSCFNKGFADLIQEHQRILEKPKIAVALGRKLIHNHLIQITTSNRSFSLIPDDDLHYLVSGTNELCNIFKDKFGSELDLTKILEWIFSKAHVEALQLQSLGPFSLCVIEAIKNSNCRCLKICLNFAIFNSTEIDKLQTVFTEFGNHQRKLGVLIKLDGSDSLMMYTVLNSNLSLPIVYGELFQEVTFTHSLTSFPLIFEWASKQWEEGNLTAENAHLIRIRFREVTTSLRAASISLSMSCQIIFRRESEFSHRISKFDEDYVTEVVLKKNNEELRIQYRFEDGTFFVTMQVAPCL